MNATSTTTRATVRATPTFEPPGPGTWVREPAHFPRPLTPWASESFPPGIRRGFEEGGERYGLLLRRLDLRTVNGWVYQQPVPVAIPGDPDADGVIGERFRAGEEAMSRKLWREDLALWDREVKPDSIRRNSELGAVDLEALTDAELAEHLARVRENHELMTYRHHQFSIPAILPVGIYAARAAELTGLGASELLGLLRGSTPVSEGLAAAELRAVGAALVEAGIGPEQFAGLQPGCTIEALLGTPRVGEAVRRYLDVSGDLIASGYDVADKAARELPDVIVGAFWSAREAVFGGSVERTDAGAGARLAAVRERVAPGQREEFDALLAEARLINRLRDERGVYNDLWAIGIARRAILEAGRRLALRGAIDDAELVFEATPAEMIALVSGGRGPSSAELRVRAQRRHALTFDDVPPFLGGEPVPPPSPDELPEPARTLERGVQVALQELFGGPGGSDGKALLGKGVSAGSYVGRARIVRGPADFNRIEKGDVLVVASTNAAFNVVLPLLGAIVTDRGALLSHAAIVAREYGIPAVVATGKATTTIPDGAIILVDGARGRVEVLL